MKNKFEWVDAVIIIGLMIVGYVVGKEFLGQMIGVLIGLVIGFGIVWGINKYYQKKQKNE